MAKSLFRALVALSFLAPLWLNAAPRVITLSPANTELAFAAGITPVGVSSYSDYPPQAQKIEQVSTWQGMNLERIVALKPDLVIMDITMPNMDGLEALKAIRKADPNASVVMCSAMGQEAMVIEAIKSGAKDFIVKPFKPDRIIKTVSSIVGQA